MSPYFYINDLLSLKAAKTGGVIRRRKSSVLEKSSLRYLQIAVKNAGFHLLETDMYYIVICDEKHMKLHF